MSSDACILTTKDFTILEAMLDRCLGQDDPTAQVLKRKLDAALVVFRDDVPTNIATLNSRVKFSVDGRDLDTRVICHDRTPSPIGLFLPIATSRGLALLGLAEGQGFRLSGHDGSEEVVLLEEVLYQPEAARRERDVLNRTPVVMPRRPALKLVNGGISSPVEGATKPGGFYDPNGPSAA